MDFLDKLALLLTFGRSSSKLNKTERRSGGVSKRVPTPTSRVPFNEKKVTFADTYYEKPEKVFNDKFVEDNPFRKRRSRKALIDSLLPFMKGRQDWAEWTYRNRYGVFTTVGIYLAVLVGFSVVSFDFSTERLPDGIYMDVKDIEEVEKILEQMKQDAERKSEAAENEKVSNTVSDENSNTNEDLSYENYNKVDPIDSRKMLDESIDKLMESRQAMRSYIAKMDKLDEELRDDLYWFKRNNDSLKRVAKQNESLHSQKKGNVTVSYALKDRRATFLEIPAYLCRGGGKVVVSIFVNRQGHVVKAEIKDSRNVTDPCVEEMAIWAAKQSTFDWNDAAESRQEGTMTYIFVAQ